MSRRLALTACGLALSASLLAPGRCQAWGWGHGFHHGSGWVGTTPVFAAPMVGMPVMMGPAVVGQPSTGVGLPTSTSAPPAFAAPMAISYGYAPYGYTANTPMFAAPTFAAPMVSAPMAASSMPARPMYQPASSLYLTEFDPQTAAIPQVAGNAPVSALGIGLQIFQFLLNQRAGGQTDPFRLLQDAIDRFGALTQRSPLGPDVEKLRQLVTRVLGGAQAPAPSADAPSPDTARPRRHVTSPLGGDQVLIDVPPGFRIVVERIGTPRGGASGPDTGEGPPTTERTNPPSGANSPPNTPGNTESTTGPTNPRGPSSR